MSKPNATQPQNRATPRLSDETKRLDGHKCSACGYDHAHEYNEAYAWHQSISNGPWERW